MNYLPPASKRVIMKARSNGFVMKFGGFGGTAGSAKLRKTRALTLSLDIGGGVDGDEERKGVVGMNEFDRGPIIDGLESAGILKPGDFTNHYVLTAKGNGIADVLEARKAKRNARKNGKI